MAGTGGIGIPSFAPIPPHLFDNNQAGMDLLAQASQGTAVPEMSIPQVPQMGGMQVGSGDKWGDALILFGEALQGKSDYRQEMQRAEAENLKARVDASLEEYKAQVEAAKLKAQAQNEVRREMADILSKDKATFRKNFEDGLIDHALAARGTAGGALLRRRLREWIPEMADLSDEELLAQVEAVRAAKFEQPRLESEQRIQRSKDETMIGYGNLAERAKSRDQRAGQFAQTLGTKGSTSTVLNATTKISLAQKELGEVQAELLRQFAAVKDKPGFRTGSYTSVEEMIQAGLAEPKTAKKLDELKPTKAGDKKPKSIRQLYLRQQELETQIGQNQAVLQREQKILGLSLMDPMQAALSDYGVSPEE